ncbi:MAG: carboxypeptidase-like regulatory domain-containing protein [Bacteroidota bacterium]
MRKHRPRLFSVLVLLLISCALHAQVAINGAVKDSLGKPLGSVSITLKKRNGIVLAFAITNATGAYKVQYANASVKDTLLVEANAIGYKKQMNPVIAANQVIDFKLNATSAKLPNVTVQNSKTILKKEGDTLNYDVASFSSKLDRTIGDVIRKLPGVEVADNGQISVGGKPINRFYIDGDNLLDGKYNIATKTIPNDMVAKIQVLENHQPVNVLKDLVKSESAAMNIVLKDKARLKLMGAGDAAAGTPDVYNVSVNAMLFKKQVKFINYTKFNNNGVDLSDDIINHFGFENQPPPSLLSAGTGGDPPLQKKRYFFNNAGLFNVNDLVNLKNQYQLRINASYLFDKQFQNSQFSSAYFLPNDTIRYSEKQEGRKTLNTFSTQFTLTANKKDYFLNNVTIVDNTPSDITAALNATTNSNISQRLSGTVTNLSNKFNIIKRTTGGTTFEASSFINTIRNPSTLQVEPGLYTTQFNNGNPYAALIQHAGIPTFYTDNYVSIGRSTAKFQQQYKIGVNYQDQQLNSLLELQQASGNKVSVADSFVNRLHWQRLKVYVQPDFTYTSGRTMLRVSIPVTYQDIRYSGRLYQEQHTDLPVTPRVYLKYMTGKEDYININYNYNNSWANIDQVYDAYLMRSYRDFFTNGNLLSQTQRHAVSGAYQFRNTLKIFFFSVGGAYTSNEGNTISDTRISSLIQQAKLIPYQNISNSSQLFGTISKYIFPLLTTIGSKVSWNQSNSVQLLNGEQLQIQNSGYTVNANVNTKFSSWLTIAYNGSFSSSGSKQTGNNHTSRPATPNVVKWQHEVNASVAFTSNVYAKIGGENYRYHIPGSQDNQYTFVDASLTWKLDKLKTDLELSLTNLAGVDTYTTASLSANSIVESSYRIRPRMAMVKFYFRF